MPFGELIITNDVPLSWSIDGSMFSIPQKSANVMSDVLGKPLNRQAKQEGRVNTPF